jgi:hypothetical protein
MAAQWIKVTHDLPSKPEIWEIAEALDMDPDTVVGKVIRVWIWFDTQSRNGHAPSVTKKILDRDVGVNGFCDAMQGAGWLAEADDEIYVPNFDHHNSKTAKERGLAAIRKQKQRSKKSRESHAPCHGDSVTKTGPDEDEDEYSISTPLTPQEEEPLPLGLNIKAWLEFVQHRKEIRKPLTKLAISKNMNVMLTMDSDEQQLSVDRTIANRWTGIFPEKNHAKSSKSRQQGVTEAGLNSTDW